MFALYVVSRSNYMVANIIIVKFRVREINRGAHPDDHINNNKKKNYPGVQFKGTAESFNPNLKVRECNKNNFKSFSVRKKNG